MRLTPADCAAWVMFLAVPVKNSRDFFAPIVSIFKQSTTTASPLNALSRPVVSQASIPLLRLARVTWWPRSSS